VSLGQSETLDRNALVYEIAAWLRHIDRLDEIPGAKWPGLIYNPLWDAANAIEREFGERSCSDCRRPVAEDTFQKQVERGEIQLTDWGRRDG
jgi:hypothetical protein